MPRYIDADALISKIAFHRDSLKPYNVVAVSAFDAVIDFIKRRPTVSPDEVRGVGCPVCQCKEPLPEDGMSHEYYIRGNTLYHYDTHFGWEGAEIRYCPECGARLEVSE